jgi:hypothetical protein
MPDITKKYFKETVQHSEKEQPETERIDRDSVTALVNGNEISLTARVRDSLTFEPENRRELGDATAVLEDSKRIIQILEIIMFNLCLALKYLLMFYFMWLLRFDHLLVYFLRTQGDKQYIQNIRDRFDSEIEDLVKDKNQLNEGSPPLV